MTASDHDVGDFRSSSTLDGHLHRMKLIIACGTLTMASLISLLVCEVMV